MTPCEGVTILDMGHKIGCNGVDNGQLIFNHYVAPRWVDWECNKACMLAR